MCTSTIQIPKVTKLLDAEKIQQRKNTPVCLQRRAVTFRATTERDFSPLVDVVPAHMAIMSYRPEPDGHRRSGK